MTDRPVLIQCPCAVVREVSAELAAGSGYALALSHDEARALLAASERFRAINPALAAAAVRSEREGMREVIADDDVQITISVRRRK